MFQHLYQEIYLANDERESGIFVLEEKKGLLWLD